MSEAPVSEGAQWAFGFCYCCGAMFLFDVLTVPAATVDVSTGRPVSGDVVVPADQPRPDTWVKQPLCDRCADKVEAVLYVLGKPPLWPVRQMQRGSHRSPLRGD